ncbi:hypothetical protein E3N88_32245 [Mikania micrantha]|uniref:Uncharacterized protein n=1 Tax=Mikania micrantha TaxID=192012 RepID=A0A5N6M8G7_9ASTR|nr:hypothetical protein E3N88_43557 [Mikania micrantha]KAD3336726.1 hypothetical protein E3N88_32245 [Mikania micrantha]
MLHLFFAVGYSAAPLIPFVPPVRNLNLVVASMEDLWRVSRIHTTRMYPALRFSGAVAFLFFLYSVECY